MQVELKLAYNSFVREEKKPMNAEITFTQRMKGFTSLNTTLCSRYLQWIGFQGYQTRNA